MFTKGWSHLYHSVTVVAAVALAATLLMSQGCASVSDSLTLSSANRNKDFSQKFTRAFACRDGEGNYDLVLVSDANDNVPIQAGSGPTLQPQPMSPRQLVYIRIFWNASSDVKAAHPVTTNAAIRWYMFGDNASDMSDLLEYSGCGLVLMNANNQTATFDVRNAFMQPVACRGCMTDPIGPGTISGTVTARVDPQKVKQFLAEVNSVDVSAPPQAQASAASATGADNSTVTR